MASATPEPMPTEQGCVVLDNRKVPCATGLIRARHRMADLASGDVLVVLSRDRFTPYELPLWAERDGHEVVAVHRDGRRPRRTFRIMIRKRQPSRQAESASHVRTGDAP